MANDKRVPVQFVHAQFVGIDRNAELSVLHVDGFSLRFDAKRRKLQRERFRERW